MTGAEGGETSGHMTRLWTPLTSFVGRSGDAVKLAGLLEGSHLVTVTGSGGVGKTRLAIEVARRVADRFPGGVWFIELSAVTGAAQVAAKVRSVLGIAEDPTRPAIEVLTQVLARKEMLLILDNCEHLLTAVAELCEGLTRGADEVRILVTSREQLGVSGETGYRLRPLTLPSSDDPEAVSRSEAVTLFVERARQADSRFTLDPGHAALAARVVTRLDGMPLAIELAAARVEALGLSGLADRIDDALRLLASKDPLTEARHRSLAAVSDWSYHLLTEPERRVFRRLAIFPGPFTLEAAEAVAGPEAALTVLRLVDCSLLAPPRLGVDQRSRYSMLQTLRSYGLERAREAGDEPGATAALAAFAWSVAREAAAGCETSDQELSALRWLDAEDATLSRAFSWEIEHDPDRALRLIVALARWLRVRGRLAEGRTRLAAAVTRSSAGSQTWAMANVWLGHLSLDGCDLVDALTYLTAACEDYRDREPSPALVEALVGRAIARLNRGDPPAQVDDARRALGLARDLGFTAGEAQALGALSVTAQYAGDRAAALDWARQAQAVLPLEASGESASIPGDIARWTRYIGAFVLEKSGELDAARRACGAGLILARRVNDLVYTSGLLRIMASVERRAGRPDAAGACLREATETASRTGDHTGISNLVEECALLCAETGRWADAATLWAAYAADTKRLRLPVAPMAADYRQRIERGLSPGQLREAEDRGARLPLPAAAEYVALVAAAVQREAREPAPRKQLSPRERELVGLVAAGRTNAEIAGRLDISVRTVASHLDRIRAKTGYRRRADLTRLALEEKLI
jgi:predicted ATPase/DNA-binding CsgD family transcriptional regulator